MKPSVLKFAVEAILGKVVDNANESHRRALVGGVNNENPTWACDVARRIVESGLQAEALASITECVVFTRTHDADAETVSREVARVEAKAKKVGLAKLDQLIAKLQEQRAYFETYVKETVASMSKLADSTIQDLSRG